MLRSIGLLRGTFGALRRPMSVEQMPSRVMSRLEEYYDSVLAEDLLTMTYDHRYANPDSPYRKEIQEMNERINKEFKDYIADKIVENELITDARKKKARISKSKEAEPTQQEAKPRDNSFLKYLDPRPLAPEVLDSLPNAYERIPRLLEVNLRMIMPQAISHDRKILMYGLMAMQLVTGQHASIMRAKEADSQLKTRAGMPIGVEIKVKNDKLMYNFVDKLVNLVLPKLRDFKGFSQHVGHGSRTVTIKLDSEAWQAFPELEMAYLKFPSRNTVGSLQEFEIDFVTSASNGEDARLLLTGFNLPLTYREPVSVYPEPAREEEDVHDV